MCWHKICIAFKNIEKRIRTEKKNIQRSASRSRMLRPLTIIRDYLILLLLFCIDKEFAVLMSWRWKYFYVALLAASPFLDFTDSSPAVTCWSNGRYFLPSHAFLVQYVGCLPSSAHQHVLQTNLNDLLGVQLKLEKLNSSSVQIFLFWSSFGVWFSKMLSSVFLRTLFALTHSIWFVHGFKGPKSVAIIGRLVEVSERKPESILGFNGFTEISGRPVEDIKVVFFVVPAGVLGKLVGLVNWFLSTFSMSCWSFVADFAVMTGGFADRIPSLFPISRWSFVSITGT